MRIPRLQGFPMGSDLFQLAMKTMILTSTSTAFTFFALTTGAQPRGVLWQIFDVLWQGRWNGKLGFWLQIVSALPLVCGCACPLAVEHFYVPSIST